MKIVYFLGVNYKGFLTSNVRIYKFTDEADLLNFIWDHNDIGYFDMIISYKKIRP